MTIQLSGVTITGATVEYIAPAAPGQVEYTTPGTYSWTVPTGVTSISILTVGAGGAGQQVLSNTGASGGAGGGLAFTNNYTVTPGGTITIVVGAGGDPLFPYGSGPQSGGNSTVTLSGTIICGASGGAYVGGSGIGTNNTASHSGGNGGAGVALASGGGGGAAGYSGDGGRGGQSGSVYGIGGSGGGGGGGAYRGGNGNGLGGSGGGVGIYGEGTSGDGGSPLGTLYGGGGSNGSSGAYGYGGNYGGGGSGGVYTIAGPSGFGGTGSAGAKGAVRIIWPGDTRFYPSTGTANV